MYLLGSGMGNPDIHNHTNLPIVLAGGRTSKKKGARHIRYEQPAPLANLHLTLLEKVGVRLDDVRRQQREDRRSGASRRVRSWR